MAGEIDARSSILLKNQRLAGTVKAQAQQELSTGLRVLTPGDDVTSFQRIQDYQFTSSTEMALMTAAQSRMSWYQSSQAFLQVIADVLSNMSAVAMRATGSDSSRSDVEALDQTFQQYKRQLSEVVDGMGGTSSVTGSFKGRPLFVGFSPPDEIGANVIIEDGGMEALNLFTGFGRAGFPEIPLTTEAGINATVPVAVTLSGTAQAGSATTIQLAGDTTTINDAFVGMEIRLTGGTGSGQSATITGYDGTTRLATIFPALATAPDATTTYTITHRQTNSTLSGVATFDSVVFAEHVWGADADRSDRISSQIGTFRALTDQEREYRELNSIPETDLAAYTDAERLERRKLNIFDPEYGSLRTDSGARTMLKQVQAAYEKITQFMGNLDARAQKIQKSYESFNARSDRQMEGASLFSEADLTEAASRLQEAGLSADKMAALASRLQQNMSRLTDLVRSGGSNQ